jgi:hypothetical protein
VAGQSPAGHTSAAGAPGSGGATSVGGATEQNTGGATQAGGSPGGTTNTGGAAETGGVTSLVGGATQSSTAKTGGTTSPGGVTTEGGTTTSVGGTTAKSGGATSSGGATTAGGTTAKSGGVTSSGGVTTAGGTTAKSGGATSSGGVTTAGGTTAKTGGATSSGGTTGGSSGSTDVVSWLNGYLWVGTCSNGSATGLDCPLFLDPSTTCPNRTATDFNQRGMFRTVTQQVGGTAGTIYTINFEARGVLGTKCYTGGTKQTPALSADPETSNDGWYLGGQPTDSLWNTYELHVSPVVAGSGAANPLNAAEDVYFLNAFPYPPITYGNDTYCEAHETFPMKYTASFKAPGGGTIKLVLHDSNCLGQMNCGGPDRQTTCAHSRTIDLTGMPQPATVATFASMQQPYKQTNGFWPQWLLFSLKSVTSQ